MKLTVIIVSYNVCYYLEQCVDSVQRATKGLEVEIFVVDNHSSDDSVDYLKRRFADTITLIECNHNLGFAKANNIAISQSSGEYVLLLNPDTFVGENSIRQVLDFMDAHPHAGGAGVMMHNADGSIARESRRGLPTPYVSLLKMLGLSSRYYMSHLSWTEPGQIDVVSGAFMMLRRSALEKVGLLDEDFFMYGEDIDLSYRIKKGGYENWYIPAHIVHYKGESTQKTSFRYVHVFYQAMLIFFRKHYGHLGFLLTLPVKIAIYCRAFLALVQMQYMLLRRYLGDYGERTADTTYYFQGQQPMIDCCMDIARRKGLAIAEEKSDSDCVVYDADTLSFEQMIADAVKQPGKQIGTYSRKTRVIITSKEIIK